MLQLQRLLLSGLLNKKPELRPSSNELLSNQYVARVVREWIRIAGFDSKRLRANTLGVRMGIWSAPMAEEDEKPSLVVNSPSTRPFCGSEEDSASSHEVAAFKDYF